MWRILTIAIITTIAALTIAQDTAPDECAALNQAMLIYENGVLLNAPDYPGLEALTYSEALAYTTGILQWTPIYMLSNARVIASERRDSVVIVFATGGNKYTAPPAPEPTPTQEQPSSSGQY